MSKCDHIIGLAFMLNPEEGPTWITRYVRQGQHPDQLDRRGMFIHCPLCGAKIEHHPDIEDYEIVTGDVPRWEG